MRFSRRSTLAAVIPAALMLAAGPAAKAQDAWPDRPIRFIVTSAAGGGIDLMARILADGLSRQLPKPIVIENAAGAGGLVATRLVAKGEPDGYTFLFQGPGHAALPYIHRNPGYDVNKDFASVSLVATFPLVLTTNPKLGVKTLPEFIAMVKAKPGKYTFGSSGIGGASHIPLEAIKEQAGLDMVHVPYRGSGATSAALIAGEIDLTIDGLAPQVGNIQTGRVVPLAVSTRERAGQLKDVATIGETLKGFEYPMWVAVFAPAKTPKAIVDKMSTAISNAMKDPAIKKRFEDLAVDGVGSSPAELDKFVQDQLAFNKKIIESANIKVSD